MRKRKRILFGLLAAGGAVVPVFFLLSSGSDGQQRIADGPRITLFSEPDFQGLTLEVTDTLVDLPIVLDERGDEFDWNDQVRSVIVVSGTWRLYQHGRCNTDLDDTPLAHLDVAEKLPVTGWSSLVSARTDGPLEIPAPERGGLDRDISSVELVSRSDLPEWVFP